MVEPDTSAREPSVRILPWDLHPALTEERLKLCARMLANGRRDALATANYALGDDAWSIGCRAYAFGRNRVRRAAETGDHPWLKVLDETLGFTFLIDQVPVRFYRGLAEEPTNRTLRRHRVESEQMSLALGREVAEDGLIFRFALETDEQGRLTRVVFLALRGEDQTICFFPVPIELAANDEKAPAQLRLIADDGYAPSAAARADAPRRRRVAAGRG